MPSDCCPNCGAELPRNARACPECGSDESTGWSEDAQTGGLDLPDDSFDYNDYVAREFGRRPPRPRGIHWGWWLLAMVLLAILLWPVLRLLR
jgi:hypothetical protein